MTEIHLLERLVDLTSVSLVIQITFFVYYLFMKWSRK